MWRRTHRFRLVGTLFVVSYFFMFLFLQTHYIRQEDGDNTDTLIITSYSSKNPSLRSSNIDNDLDSTIGISNNDHFDKLLSVQDNSENDNIQNKNTLIITTYSFKPPSLRSPAGNDLDSTIDTSNNDHYDQLSSVQGDKEHDHSQEKIVHNIETPNSYKIQSLRNSHQISNSYNSNNNSNSNIDTSNNHHKKFPSTLDDRNNEYNSQEEVVNYVERPKTSIFIPRREIFNQVTRDEIFKHEETPNEESKSITREETISYIETPIKESKFLVREDIRQTPENSTSLLQRLAENSILIRNLKETRLRIAKSILSRNVDNSASAADDYTYTINNKGVVNKVLEQKQEIKNTHFTQQISSSADENLPSQTDNSNTVNNRDISEYDDTDSNNSEKHDSIKSSDEDPMVQSEFKDNLFNSKINVKNFDLPTILDKRDITKTETVSTKTESGRLNTNENNYEKSAIIRNTLNDNSFNSKINIKYSDIQTVHNKRDISETETDNIESERLNINENGYNKKSATIQSVTDSNPFNSKINVPNSDTKTADEVPFYKLSDDFYVYAAFLDDRLAGNESVRIFALCPSIVPSYTRWQIKCHFNVAVTPNSDNKFISTATKTHSDITTTNNTSNIFSRSDDDGQNMHKDTNKLRNTFSRSDDDGQNMHKDTNKLRNTFSRSDDDSNGVNMHPNINKPRNPFTTKATNTNYNTNSDNQKTHEFINTESNVNVDTQSQNAQEFINTENDVNSYPHSHSQYGHKENRRLTSYIVEASKYTMCENHDKQYGGWIFSCLANGIHALPSSQNQIVISLIKYDDEGRNATSSIKIPLQKKKSVEKEHKQFIKGNHNPQEPKLTSGETNYNDIDQFKTQLRKNKRHYQSDQVLQDEKILKFVHHETQSETKTQETRHTDTAQEENLKLYKRETSPESKTNTALEGHLKFVNHETLSKSKTKTQKDMSDSPNTAPKGTLNFDITETSSVSQLREGNSDSNNTTQKGTLESDKLWKSSNSKSKTQNEDFTNTAQDERFKFDKRETQQQNSGSNINTNNTFNIGVCVPPLHGDIDLTKIVNFVEMSRIMKASHVHLYINDLSDDMRQSLQDYARLNPSFLKLINWNLPVVDTSNSRPSTTEQYQSFNSSSSSSSSLPSSSSPYYYPTSTEGIPVSEVIWNRGQLLAIQHCLYSNMYAFDWMLFIDIDEMLYPRYVLTWEDFLREALAEHKSNSSSRPTHDINHNNNNTRPIPSETSTSKSSDIDYKTTAAASASNNVNTSGELTFKSSSSFSSPPPSSSLSSPSSPSSKITGFVFQSANFDTHVESQAQYSVDYFQKLAREEKIDPARTKMFIRPTHVFEMGIHHLSKPLVDRGEKAGHVLQVDPAEALVHHYRESGTEATGQVTGSEQWYLKYGYDNSSLRYEKALTKASQLVMNRLNRAMMRRRLRGN